MAIKSSNHCQEASAVVAELLTSGIPLRCTNCHNVSWTQPRRGTTFLADKKIGRIMIFFCIRLST